MITETSRFTWYRAYTWGVVMAYGDPTWRPVEVEPFTRTYDFDDEQSAVDAARQASANGKIRVIKVDTVHTVIRDG